MADSSIELSSVLLNNNEAQKLGRLGLIIVRHAQSEGNVFPRQGFLGIVDPALTELGRNQATLCGKYFVDLDIREPSIVFTSCLLRAQQTALLVFPKQPVIRVAPYVSEMHWGNRPLFPDATPKTRAEQQEVVQRDISDAARVRLGYAEAPPQPSCGPPDWNNFLNWLWNVNDVQTLVRSAIETGTLPNVALVSHGCFLATTLRKHGWEGTRMNNVEVIVAELPFRYNADNEACGFGSLDIKRTVFAGFPDNRKKDWSMCLFATAMLLLAIMTILTWFGLD